MEDAARGRVVLDVSLATVGMSGGVGVGSGEEGVSGGHEEDGIQREEGGGEDCEDVDENDAVCQEVYELVECSRSMGGSREAVEDERGEG